MVSPPRPAGGPAQEDSRNAPGWSLHLLGWVCFIPHKPKDGPATRFFQDTDKKYKITSGNK